MKLTNDHSQNSLLSNSKIALVVMATIVSICMCSFSWSATSISDSSQPPTAQKANSIFLKMTGIESYPTSGSFTINAICPTGFTAYVAISAGSQDITSAHSLLTQSMTCVTGVSQSASNISVSYKAQTQYQTVTNITHSNRYVGTNAWAYTLWSSDDMPDTNTITTTQSTDTGAIDQFTWSLYCYPTGMTLPGYCT